MTDTPPIPRPTVYVADPVRMVHELYRDLCGPGWCDRPIRDHLSNQADRLLAAHTEADPASAVEIGNWLERLLGADRETVLADTIELEDTRAVVARSHGFRNWTEVEQLGEARPAPAFEKAVDAVVGGQVSELAFLLDENECLARGRSNYGHAATLLHYSAANGVETRRQTVPSNAAQILEMLLAAGADPNARARVYGGEFPVLPLLMSGEHPAASGVLEEMEAMLVNAGGAY